MEKKEPLNMTLKTAAVFISLAGIVTLLLFFKSFLQPLIVALLLWFIIIEVRSFLSRFKVKGRSLPKFILTLVSTLIVFFIFYLSIDIVVTNIEKLAANFDHYSKNIIASLEQLKGLLGIENLGDNIQEQKQAIVKSAANAAASLASFIGSMLMVLFYVIFILLEEANFKKKIEKMYHLSEGNNLQRTWKSIHALMHDYMSIKMLTSFITGLLSFFVLLFLGIELPALWAFIIFILNFIPSIGSIIATAFPVLFSYVQYADIKQTVSVFIGILAIQVLVGNVLEPKLMGNKLNLSPLVVIIGLVFWGFIWGVMGMLLSVPIMASLMIVFSQFRGTRRLAIFLSQNGEIDSLVPEENEDSIE